MSSKIGTDDNDSSELTIPDAVNQHRPVSLMAKAFYIAHGIDEEQAAKFLRNAAQTTEKFDLSFNELVPLIFNELGNHFNNLRGYRDAQVTRRMIHGKNAKRFVCMNPCTGEHEVACKHTRKTRRWQREYGVDVVASWTVYID